MKNLCYLLFLILLCSCSKEPQPIVYGTDACDYCEMTIVDPSYAAQAVSNKGKQFKYDAIECMVNDLHNHSVAMTTQQVANFSNPGHMIPVEKAIFIINDSLNSPMGANLAAIKKESSVALQGSSGTFFWNDLVEHLQAKDSVFKKE